MFNYGAKLTLQDNFTATLKKIQQQQKRFVADVKAAKREMDATWRQKYAPNLEVNKAISAVRKFRNAFKSSMGDVDKETKKKHTITVDLKDKVSSGLNSIKSKLASALKWGVAGAAAGAGYLFTKALQNAGNQEQTQMAFSTMMGSQAKGTDMINRFRQFAVETPFEYADLVGNARYAMAMGFKPEDILSKDRKSGLMVDVGNATSALGIGSEGIENIIRALGQMQQKGKVSAQEINQLAENGIGAWNYISKAMGVTVAQAMKLGEQGLIPADKAIQSIRKGMQKDFGGMMIKQSQTLLGLWSSLKDLFNVNILTDFGEGIRQAILPEFSKLVNGFTQGGDSAKKMKEAIMNAGRQVGQFIINRYNDLKSFFKIFDDPEFKKLSTGDKIIAVIKQAMSGVKAWLDAGGKEKLREIANKVATVLIDVLKGAMTQLTPIAVEIGKAIVNGIGQGILEAPGAKLSNALTSKFQSPDAARKAQEAWGNNPAPSASQQRHMANNPDMLLTMLNLNSITREQAKQYYPDAYQKLVDSGKAKAFGMNRVPYDGYPAILHEGEKVLTKGEANRQTGGIVIAKIADSIVIREEADIDKIAKALVREIETASANYGGVY